MIKNYKSTGSWANFDPIMDKVSNPNANSLKGLEDDGKATFEKLEGIEEQYEQAVDELIKASKINYKHPRWSKGEGMMKSSSQSRSYGYGNIYN